VTVVYSGARPSSSQVRSSFSGPELPATRIGRVRTTTHGTNTSTSSAHGDSPAIDRKSIARQSELVTYG
jgi:hypothetical protein